MFRTFTKLRDAALPLAASAVRRCSGGSGSRIRAEANCPRCDAYMSVQFSLQQLPAPPPAAAGAIDAAQHHNHDGAGVCPACRGAFLFRAQRIDPLRGAFLEIPGGVGADDEDAESGGFADRIKRMLSERPPDEFPPLPQSPPMQMPHYQSRRKTRRRQREEGGGGGGGGNDNGGDSSSGGEGTSASPKREWWGGASLGDELPTPREMCGRLEAEWLAGFPVPAPLPRSSSRCKGQKRKLEDEASAAAAASSLGSAGADDDNEEEDGSAGTPEICCRHSHAALAREVRVQVDVLVRCASSWRHADRAAAKRATHVLAELAKNEEVVNVIVEGGAVAALVCHLEEPAVAAPTQEEQQLRPFEHEVEKGAAFALGLLAVKPEHQQLIVDAGALPPLVKLLKRQKNTTNSRVVNSVIKRAADAITNLAHENSNIKTSVRMEGGIPPLVELLESQDLKVQRAAAGALRTLAFKNDENKTQIVQCNALPTLILMLRSEDAAIHYEAVGVIGNLVHSSPNIKKEVLNAGALQPVIGLLSSCCTESQREAALLLGQFASADSDCKVHIVQRGAVRPLIEMLQSADVQLREMSAFALGRLAQDTHNQAGIAYNGGLAPLLKLLDSKNGSLQHNAAFALYGVADNEDYVSDFIKVGGVQKLQDGEFIVQATKDCVAKTLKRLEEKINGRVLKHLLYLMRVGEKSVQRRVALALAHLCAPEDQRTIFIDNNGLDLLLDLLISMSSKHQQDGSAALYKLANKAAALSPMDAAPPSPTPQVYLGEQYVNSSTLSDVTFLVEGKRFYAHRIALLASSDAFRAMFDGGYREKDARDIEIPNIKWEVFELMMRFIYTGSVQVTSEIAQDLLRAADQYLLEGLKRLCEYTIAKDVNLDNVSDMYDLSEAFHAVSLRHTCILYILEHFNKICTRAGSPQLIQRVIPELRNFLTKALSSSRSPSPSDRNSQI